MSTEKKGHPGGEKWCNESFFERGKIEKDAPRKISMYNGWLTRREYISLLEPPLFPDVPRITYSFESENFKMENEVREFFFLFREIYYSPPDGRNDADPQLFNLLFHVSFP